MKSGFLHCTFVLVALWVLTADASAQDATVEQTVPTIELQMRAAMAMTGSGMSYCDAGPALSGGIEAVRESAFRFSVTVDFLVSSRRSCDGFLQIAAYEGETVAVEGFSDFFFSPRVGAHVGLWKSDDSRISPPTVGVGLMRTRTDYGQRGPRQARVERSLVPGRGALTVGAWRPWVGFTQAIRITDGGAKFEFGGGYHSVPTRYYELDDGPQVSEFKQWKEFLRLGIAWPLGSTSSGGH